MLLGHLGRLSLHLPVGLIDYSLPLPLRLSGGPLPGGLGLRRVIGMLVVIGRVLVGPSFDFVQLAPRFHFIVPLTPIRHTTGWVQRNLGAHGNATFFEFVGVEVPRCNDFVVVMPHHDAWIRKATTDLLRRGKVPAFAFGQQIYNPNLMCLAPWDRMNRMVKAGHHSSRS